ncbi:hypothetical protein TNCV_1054401 [Trichonephila clavipes]|nr:hypothetical protein TNCV_1054401 [Trichonephila clavipes]
MSSKCKKDMRLVERKGTIDGFEWRCRVQSNENPHFACRSVTTLLEYHCISKIARRNLLVTCTTVTYSTTASLDTSISRNREEGDRPFCRGNSQTTERLYRERGSQRGASNLRMFINLQHNVDPYEDVDCSSASRECLLPELVVPTMKLGGNDVVVKMLFLISSKPFNCINLYMLQQDLIHHPG